ncbi:MAG TPA: WD40 repeat domain-containing protein [Pyrinomonadaceae bacterium]|nr:WD40 repeat domain-containing protein [Pyrinomonadaceae bacterium]
MSANVKPGVAGLSLSRDGKTLIVAGGDARIRFVDLATGEEQRTFTGHTNAIYRAIFSPDEKLLASSSRDLTARIWDVSTGRELWKLTGFRCSVKAVAFSPDGRLLAAAGNDGMVKLYDVKTGKEVRSLVHINSADIDMSVYSVKFGRDSNKVYAGNGDGTISEWDVATGKETRVWKAHDRTAFKVAFSPDYSLLASFGDSVVKLWDTRTWREVRSLSMIRPDAVNLSSEVTFSNDGKLIAASNVGLDQKQTSYLYVQTIVWDVNSGEKLFTIEGHKFDVDGLVFTQDNQFLLTGSVDTTIKFWDMKTGKLSKTFTVPPNEKTN